MVKEIETGDNEMVLEMDGRLGVFMIEVTGLWGTGIGKIIIQ
jgi:hypothetical protein